MCFLLIYNLAEEIISTSKHIPKFSFLILILIPCYLSFTLRHCQFLFFSTAEYKHFHVKIPQIQKYFLYS